MNKNCLVALTFFIFLLYGCQLNEANTPVIPVDLTTELRAPAYPLVTVDPYFNAWSYTDNLYDDHPRHWTDKEFPLLGALRVDGEVYRFMGKEILPLKPILPAAREEKEETKVSFDRTAEQKSVSVLPTQTIYTFDCGPVELEVIFTSPLLLDDLMLISRPVSYLTYQVRSKDGVSHDIQVYFEATPQWAVHDDGQTVDFERIEKEGKMYLKTGTVEQPVLQKKGDAVRIDWGYFYLTGEGKGDEILNFGDYWNPKEVFQTTGHITEELPQEISGNMTQEMTVLAYSRDLGKVASEKKAGFIMLGYDDIYSIQYFEKNLKGYWTNDGTVDIFQAFKSAETDYDSIMERCDGFNRTMLADAEKAGGKKYAELASLAYRQAIAAHKLVKDENGTLLFLSKENNSNGSIGTVDITYPSSPLFLLYNPELVKGLMNHIFYYSESGRWTKPFPAHDIGTYPIGNGQTYGEDMPIEEGGNMLILTTAIAEMEGNADYAARHWGILTTWTDYLVEEGLDPDDQLCTDDFAGHLAHNANLSIKAIMGIASYGRLASMLGKTDVAEEYLGIARTMAVEWEKMARDGNHYKLTFDRAGTWSQKYNLVWDRLLGFNIFDPEIARKEMDYYLTVQNKYGLPLDNRATYTKSDWIMWTATLTGEMNDFNVLVDHVYKYAYETSSRVPISDWHDTVTAERQNFKARSVVGGYFMKMLEQKLLHVSKY